MSSQAIAYKAVILSAGQGSRLLPYTEHTPKALLDLGGRSLLAWQLNALDAVGVHEVVVVTGFRDELIDRAVAQHAPNGMRVRTLYNPFYRLADNLASCWMARAELSDACLILNGDTLFEPEIARRLLAAPPASITVTIDRKPVYDADDMKVAMDGDRLKAIGKKLPVAETHGESIGFLRFDAVGAAQFVAEIERVMRTPEGPGLWYLSAINGLAQSGADVRVVSIEGLQWGELDFPADLVRNRAMVAGWRAGSSGASGAAQASMSSASTQRPAASGTALLSATDLPELLAADTAHRHVAFLFVGEAQHVAHTAPVACYMAATEGDLRPWFLITDAAMAPILREVEAAYAGAAPIPIALLEPSRLTRYLNLIRRLRRSRKLLTLLTNRRLLASFEAVVAAERTSTVLRKWGLKTPTMVHIPHGAGDRKRGFDPRIRRFDLTILGGRKDAERMLSEKLIRPGHYAISGYIKRDFIQRRLRSAPPLFDNGRLTVLYNPHFDLSLSSWQRHGRELIDMFAAQDQFNLVVAPHVRLFADASDDERARWQRLAVPDRILIDTGSTRSIDASYTLGCDIYLGDVSSQVYEFIMRPRPCVFLNSFRVDWVHDPNYAHWKMGQVIERPDGLMEALRQAHSGFEAFRPIQAAALLAAFGPDDGQAPARAAAAIARYLLHGHVPAA